VFIGRDQELKQLNKLKDKTTSSLVCVLGRRRIGKSTLIEEFAKKFKNFINIQGLAPNKGITNKTQLEHFSRQLALQFKKDKIIFDNWEEAFEKLGQYSQKGEFLIFLDEISWMGKGDPAFSSYLKEKWDLLLKKNSKLILVVCGSVSSWIEENILKNMSFEGRISLEINLEELSLIEANEFLKKKQISLSIEEQILALSIMGGVPKYLEELIKTETLEKNILRMCYTPEGILFNDFEKVFTDIFGRKSKTLEKIVRSCLMSKLSPSEISKKVGRVYNEEMHDHFHILELSGFLSRDYYYKPDGKISKLSHLRIKDNYLRFYLKNIEPFKNEIQKKSISIRSFKDIKNFNAIMGYQFENLMLSNKTLIYKVLDLESNNILFASPHIQRKTKANKGACQVDLLIGTQQKTFYVCEFKTQSIIDKNIVKEVSKKLRILQTPKTTAVYPILIHAGQIYPPHETEIQQFFFKVISFENLLEP